MGIAQNHSPFRPEDGGSRAEGPVVVLHVRNSVVVGGPEVALVAWMRYGETVGVAHRLFILERRDGLHRTFQAYLAARGIKAQLLPYGSRRGAVAAALALRREIIRQGACVVHSHDSGSDVVTWLATLGRSTPRVAGEYAWHSLCPGIGYGVHFSEFVRSRILRRFDRVIDVSEATRRESLRRGIPADRVVTIPLAVDLDGFGQGVDREAARAKLGIRPGEIAVGNMARLHYEKGQKDLLTAAAAVVSRHSAVRFLIIGDGPLLADLEAQRRELELEQRVTFAGFQDDSAAALAALDIFILPSLMEGAPLVLLEAMTMGLPIVATDVAGVSEILSDGKTAILVRSGDIEGLVRATERLLADPELRRSLGAEARATVRNDPRFSARPAAASMATVYREVLRGRNDPRLVVPTTVPRWVKVALPGFTKPAVRAVICAGADLLDRIRGQTKPFMPPARLRTRVGCFRAYLRPGPYQAVGEEFVGHLETLAGLRPDSRVLDIGCGCGQMAAQLTQRLSTAGSYEGLDPDPEAIDWCRKRISSVFPNFRFIHVDLHNRHYNPHGLVAGASFRFPYVADSFDLIILKSIFTHLLLDPIEHYLGEIRRLLTHEGRCLATFFLLNAESLRGIEGGEGPFALPHVLDGCRVMDPTVPEYLVAQPEQTIRELATRRGLVIEEPIRYGSWPGRSRHLSFQDIIIFGRGSHV